MATAQNFNTAIDFNVAADQRINFPCHGFFIEIDAIGRQRIGTGRAWRLGCILLCATRRLLFRHACFFGDAVRDKAHRIISRHVLLLQEVGGMALAFGENRDQNIRTGHFITAGNIDMLDRTLNNALESCGWLYTAICIHIDQRRQVFIDVFCQVQTELLQIDGASFHDLGCIWIVNQGEQ